MKKCIFCRQFSGGPRALDARDVGEDRDNIIGLNDTANNLDESRTHKIILSFYQAAGVWNESFGFAQGWFRNIRGGIQGEDSREVYVQVAQAPCVVLDGDWKVEKGIQKELFSLSRRKVYISRMYGQTGDMQNM